MTPSILKFMHLRSDRPSRFFDMWSMRVRGDTMANFGVRTAWVRSVNPFPGVKNFEPVEVWELWRKKPLADGSQRSCFFSKNTHCMLINVMKVEKP